MSVTAMGQCWGPEFPAESELPISSGLIRLIAVAIADMVSDGHNNEFYMSRPNLAKKVGLGLETIRLGMKHLVTVGVLEVLHHRPGHTTVYRWTYDPNNPTVIRGSTVPTVGYPTAPTVGTPPHVRCLTQSNPKREPKNPSRRERRAPELSQGAEMDFGAEPKNEPGGRVHSRRTAKEVPFGSDTDYTPVPKRKKTSVAVVISRFHERWQGVREKWPRYFNEKGLDTAAFGGYLKTEFFGPEARSPMPVENVVILVDAFMDDLFRGQFWLEPGQPAWRSFARRWNGYSERLPSATAAPTPGHLRYRWDGDELVEVG